MQSFQSEIEMKPIPRVERHRTPLNPGLCHEAPLELLKKETPAGTAEPFHVSPPEAAVYLIAINEEDAMEIHCLVHESSRAIAEKRWKELAGLNDSLVDLLFCLED